MSRFSHEDAFPLIARLIRERSAREGGFVSHDELVDALMADPSGAKLIEAAAAYPENKWSAFQWASNMVAWFSQRITQESSDYAAEFERESRPDGYAYRPARAS